MSGTSYLSIAGGVGSTPDTGSPPWNQPDAVSQRDNTFAEVDDLSDSGPASDVLVIDFDPSYFSPLVGYRFTSLQLEGNMFVDGAGFSVDVGNVGGVDNFYGGDMTWDGVNHVTAAVPTVLRSDLQTYTGNGMSESDRVQLFLNLNQLGTQVRFVVGAKTGIGKFSLDDITLIIGYDAPVITGGGVNTLVLRDMDYSCQRGVVPTLTISGDANDVAIITGIGSIVKG